MCLRCLNLVKAAKASDFNQPGQVSQTEKIARFVGDTESIRKAMPVLEALENL